MATVGALACACAGNPEHPPRTDAPEDNIAFSEIAPGVWTHTTETVVERWGRVPASGLVVIGDDAIVLVDAGWHDWQTSAILDWVERTFGRPVSAALFTHAHGDKMGGVAAIKARAIPNFAFTRTNAIAIDNGLEPASDALYFDDDGAPIASAATATLTAAGIEVFYPGAGHTVDNIIVGVPRAGVLFGGCLVRPGGAKTLGNTADADVTNWARSVARVAARFPDAAIVIPTHGSPGGRELLTATRVLAETAAAR